MKKSLLLIASFGLFTSAFSQCNELFFSEYIEGSHNNKALEIYNPTANAIDLSTYSIIRWSNGSTSSDQDIRYVQPLSGTIQPYDVFLAIVDRRDAQGTGQDTAIFQGLWDAGNMYNSGFYSPDYNSGTQGSRVLVHNGDDAITLMNGANIVDIFGLVGEQPQQAGGGTGTAGWTDTAPYWDGNGAYWTKDQTLIRKSSVLQGATAILPPYQGNFNPTLEWDSLPRNTFNMLGFHNCACDPNNAIVEGAEGKVIKLFPNPITNNVLTITTPEQVQAVEVRNVLGQLVYNEGTAPNSSIQIDLTGNEQGIYFVTVLFADQTFLTEKVTLK